MIVTSHDAQDIAQIEQTTQKFFVGWLAVERCYCVPVFTHTVPSENERRERVLSLNGRGERSVKPALPPIE